jgi:hypothetical protein
VRKRLLEGGFIARVSVCIRGAETGRSRVSALVDRGPTARYCMGLDAGWSSLVARRAHNPEVAGSNPAPAILDPRRGGRSARSTGDAAF